MRHRSKVHSNDDGVMAVACMLPCFYTNAQCTCLYGTKMPRLFPNGEDRIGVYRYSDLYIADYKAC
jgi:hypothetical protein